jgi:hypothetical protein
MEFGVNYRAARGRQDFGVHGTPYVLSWKFSEQSLINHWLSQNNEKAGRAGLCARHL